MVDQVIATGQGSHPQPPQPKQVKLGLVWGRSQYEVKTITNSAEFVPGQWVDRDVIARVCLRPNWEVTIADDQTFLQIIGFIASKTPTPPI